MEVVVTKQASAVETKLQDLFTAMSQFLVESSDNNDQARLALYSALNKFQIQCDSLYLFLQSHYRQLQLERSKMGLQSDDKAMGFVEYMESQEAAEAIEQLLGPDLARARACPL